MSEITNNLWLSSWEDAKKLVPLLNNPLVINCTKDLGYLTKSTIRIPIDDNQSEIENLNNYIFWICKIINDTLIAGGEVVVHCLAGRQRSAAVIVSYLMIYNKSIKDPANFVKNVKQDIFFPYTNFQKTLDFVKAQSK